MGKKNRDDLKENDNEKLVEDNSEYNQNEESVNQLSEPVISLNERLTGVDANGSAVDKMFNLTIKELSENIQKCEIRAQKEENHQAVARFASISHALNGLTAALRSVVDTDLNYFNEDKLEEKWTSDAFPKFILASHRPLLDES